MFYAHFVLSKKGPLARIWLAAHWDKKLTKAHVFETNIDSSVEAIIQPKVKMALRTSGHLLLGVVRIYSRKAKYLLADCNEAFVKIKMAFRPGVVDLPEENREAAVATITLPETFHDFDTTMADLNDIDVQAQFSVNQSRPEEITMKEDLGNITLVGDDGFGDMDHMGFDENEMMRGGSGMDETLFKNAEPALIEENDKDRSADKMDISNEDLGGGFGGVYDDDDDDDDGGPPGAPSDDDEDFGGGVDHELFGDNFMEAGGLFEDPPMPDVSLAQEPDPSQVPLSQKEAEVDKQPGLTEEDLVLNAADTTNATTGAPDNTAMTTIVQNDKEAFALEPLDITSVPGGTERKGKRKRKLIVDEQKGIASETMKLQLSDTSDICTTLDLAPPTKKLMHWKETGGVEKLFALPGRPIISKRVSKMFYKNLITRPISDPEEDDPLELEAPRDEEQELEHFHDGSTIIGDASRSDLSLHLPRARSRKHNAMDTSNPSEMMPPPPVPELPPVAAPVTAEQPRSPQPEPVVDPMFPVPEPEPVLAEITEPLLPPEPATPQLAETSAAPEEQAGPTEKELEMNDDIFMDNLPALNISNEHGLHTTHTEKNPDDELDTEGPAEGTEEFEERRWNKRSQQMLYVLQRTLRKHTDTSFKEMVGQNNRKIVASKFYTLLVLKKQQAIEVEQNKPYGDIVITKGPRFTTVC